MIDFNKNKYLFAITITRVTCGIVIFCFSRCDVNTCRFTMEEKPNNIQNVQSPVE